jgi:hypothetical protein
MNLTELLKYKDALRREYEKDMAAIDRIIDRLTPAGGTPDSLPGLLDEVRRKQGRPPGGLIRAVRGAILKTHGKPFSLGEIADLVAREDPASRFERKAISSALGRMAAKRKEIRVLEKGVNGQSATVYVIADSFPQAR